jgi:hypothetical protein
MAVKQFNITMTNGIVQSVNADYYSCDAAQYIFYKHDRNWEVQEVYRVLMTNVKSIASNMVLNP